MDGPSRSGGFRQSRRSRSRRDRERRRRREDLAEHRASSPSSASDQELCRRDSLLGANGGECRPGFPGVRHRPPRRRKRESVSCEEDIIDGFAIASFISLEALEMDSSLKPAERSGLLMGRGIKRKRALDENGGPLSEPEEGPPATYTNSWEQRRKMKSKLKRKGAAKVSGSHMETGYICDTESESGDKASDNMEPAFIVCTREAVNSISASSAVGNGCPLLPSNSSLPLLSVTPRVSGLERSQERSMEQPYPEPISTSSSLPSLIGHSTASVSTSIPDQRNGNGGPHHRYGPSPPRRTNKPFLPFPGKSQSIFTMGSNNRSSTSGKPPSSSASSLSIRPPTPATSVSLGRGPGGVGTVRPSSRPSPGAIFTPSPSLPPPPPLLQVSPHPSTDQDLICQDLPESSAPGGPSVSSSSSGTSSRSSQAQTSIPTMAYQFHQHNHQHQHTHTHQHFLHHTAPAPPLFEKYPGKIEGLFRHPFFPQYPPSVPGIQPVLPPTGPFSSLRGAFQPKRDPPSQQQPSSASQTCWTVDAGFPPPHRPNRVPGPQARQRFQLEHLVAIQGAAPEMTPGLGVVPPHLQPKTTRLTDPFAPPPKVSNKPGKWCAMHVRVAWMILRHQEKVKLMQADPQKLDFRNDLLTRLPGPGIGGLGGLGQLGGPLAPTHDLTRPGSLFAAAGGVNPSSTPFMPPSTPHSSFLTPAAHLDPYGRSPPFTSLGALSSGAFGGLGSPTIAASVFGHKTEPSASAVGGLGNPHDPWNRLHVTPASFPSGSSWAKGPEKRDDRGKDMERRELTHIKDEKDRDSILYGRQSMRMSPGVPNIKHRSSTPSSHMNGLGSLSGGGVQSDSQSRERDREREADKRQHSASRAAASASSAAPDRPRSSTSSTVTTPPSAPLAHSPLDLFHRQPPHTLSTESSQPSQRENNGPATSSSASSHPVKKPDRTTTPVSKPAFVLTSGLLLPQVKVKEERKEEPEPVPISLQHHAVPPHSFERPSSRHPHHPSTPSSTLSLTPTPGVPLPPQTQHPAHHLSLLDRTRAIDAYLGGAGGSAGLVIGADRFPPHPHAAPQGHSQATHSFPWDPWRDLAVQQQQQRREVLALRSDPHLALRSDPHLSRLLQHQQVHRYLEAERAAVAAAVATSPHHPPVPTSTSSASSSANRPEFGLMSHPFDEEQRAQILREDFERARYFGMHPHSHLSAPHLSSPSHAAHLEQLHAGLLSHSHLHPAGASTPSHHPGLYSRLGPLHSHSHVPNGILTKTPSLVGALSVGAPPPLIPSVNRPSTPNRGSRHGGAGDLALFATHKDGESR
ncbi:autism susceptibility gene 2 protein-like isoform X5 [Myxocyprinus asiaticus]|uniref:autism susceptibility gene 2 protein-like isoform X5 n=1 Tax=Myxocyprinus asiaticus TaxID=70543 RepID=UPI00222311C1|nr:autism susceptibility gene 2 protein-like isoform X5 [Myxocyprinus asiaticus]